MGQPNCWTRKCTQLSRMSSKHYQILLKLLWLLSVLIWKSLKNGLVTFWRTFLRRNKLQWLWKILKAKHLVQYQFNRIISELRRLNDLQRHIVGLQASRLFYQMKTLLRMPSMKSLRQSSFGAIHEYKLHLMNPLEFKTEFANKVRSTHFVEINFDATRMRLQFAVLRRSSQINNNLCLHS